ncbi:hypothetical protein Q5O14_17840 [Eubacteriaceae bacterium ES2]|nr:hypothetical protein Q5O14_17840 [Eubacteriaceae bacterium ES2]
MTIEEAERLRSDYNFGPAGCSEKRRRYKNLMPVVTSNGEVAMIAEQPYQKFLKNKKINILETEATETGVLMKYSINNSSGVGIVEFKDVSDRIKED